MRILGIYSSQLVLVLVLGVEITRTTPVDPALKTDVAISKKEQQSQEAELDNISETEIFSLPAADKNELKRAPPPGGYYVYTKHISCASVTRVRELWDAMARNPVRDAQNWRELDNQIGTNAVNQIIHDTQRRAYGCICSHLPLVGGDGPGLKLRPVHTSEHCKDDRAARMYEKVYGCGCFELYTQQGPEADGIPTGEGGGLEGSLLLGGIPDGIHDKMRTTPLNEEYSSYPMAPGDPFTGFQNFHLGDYAADRQLPNSGWGRDSVKGRMGGLGGLKAGGPRYRFAKRAGNVEPHSPPTANAKSDKLPENNNI